MRLVENEAAPYVGMVLATTAQVGRIIISKKAMASGMTNFTFVVYSNALALHYPPPSISSHPQVSPNRPPLNFLILCGFFALGVLGCLAQLTGYTGINYTSAEFASAMLNLIPGFTFILAVIFRMEKLALKSSSFAAKTVGTVVSIIGAFIVTLYKGPQILTSRSSSNLYDLYKHTPQSSWIIGGLFLTIDCAAASGHIIVQAVILKKYPAELVMVFFYCFFAAILSTVVSLVVDRDFGAWALQPNIRLFAVLYSGIFGYAFQVGMTTWCLHRKGPLFVAMFHPLSIVIAAVLGTVFLGDILYLGSVVGSIIIVVGFYSMMWGKSKESKVVGNNDPGSSNPISETTPLLLNKDI